MKRADFEVPVSSPLPYLAALLSAAGLFFATFLIFPAVSSADSAHTISPDEVTYTHELFFRYSDGIPFYDACFMVTYTALAALCLFPAAKKRPLVFILPFVSHIISAASHSIEVYGKIIAPTMFFLFIFTALFAFTAAGIIRVQYAAGGFFAFVALIYAATAVLYKKEITSICDDFPMMAFFAAYALICFSFRDRSKE